MTTLRILVASFILAGIGLVSQQASAEGLGRFSLSYTSHTSTDSGVDATSSRMIYDIGGYYKFQGSNWYLGALYQNDSTTAGGTSTPRTSYGVSGGWVTNKDSGFLLIATYFISSKDGDYTDGNGYQIDVGYRVPTKIPLVLQMSYKHYDYSKFNHSDTYMDPYFGALFFF